MLLFPLHRLRRTLAPTTTTALKGPRAPPAASSIATHAKHHGYTPLHDGRLQGVASTDAALEIEVAGGVVRQVLRVHGADPRGVVGGEDLVVGERGPHVQRLGHLLGEREAGEEQVDAVIHGERGVHPRAIRGEGGGGTGEEEEGEEEEKGERGEHGHHVATTGLRVRASRCTERL